MTQRIASNISDARRPRSRSALAACARSRAAAGQNAIEAINVAGQQGGKVDRQDHAEGAAGRPRRRASRSPTRRASRSTFPNTVNALGRSSQEVGEGDLRSINVVQAGDRTRLVLNLAARSTYEPRSTASTVLHRRSQARRRRAARRRRRGHAFRRSRARRRRRTALRDVDFRRGNAGEGRVVVDLSDSADRHRPAPAGPPASSSTSCNTALPENLERRLDVGDFGTPVQTIDTFAAGRQRAHGDRAARLLGALGLPDRQPLHRRGEAGHGRSEQAGAGHAGLHAARSCRSTSRTSKCARCCR